MAKCIDHTHTISDYEIIHVIKYQKQNRVITDTLQMTRSQTTTDGWLFGNTRKPSPTVQRSHYFRLSTQKSELIGLNGKTGEHTDLMERASAIMARLRYMELFVDVILVGPE